MFEIYLAAMQAGFYIVPINHHLVAPEIAYIVKDSGAQVFIGHERFADACVAAAKEAGVPADKCLAVGDDPRLRLLRASSGTRRRPTAPMTAASATP